MRVAAGDYDVTKKERVFQVKQIWANSLNAC